MQLDLEAPDQSSTALKQAPSETSSAEENRNCRLRIEETFKSFGMGNSEINVYLYLAEEGPKIAREICKTVKIHRTETYRMLRHLEKRGLVYVLLEKPVRFSAIPVDKAIDLLVDAQMTRLQIIQNQKEDLVRNWLALPHSKREALKTSLLQKIEGEQQIILKAHEIVDQAKRELKLFVTDQYLATLYYSDFFDKLKKLQRKLDISLITESSQRSNYFLEKIKWPSDRHGTVNAGDLPCFIISDNAESLVAFSEEDRFVDAGHKRKVKNTAVWTNYEAIATTLLVLFQKKMP